MIFSSVTRSACRLTSRCCLSVLVSRATQSISKPTTITYFFNRGVNSSSSVNFSSFCLTQQAHLHNTQLLELQLQKQSNKKDYNTITQFYSPNTPAEKPISLIMAENTGNGALSHEDKKKVCIVGSGNW